MHLRYVSKMNIINLWWLILISVNFCIGCHLGTQNWQATKFENGPPVTGILRISGAVLWAMVFMLEWLHSSLAMVCMHKECWIIPSPIAIPFLVRPHVVVAHKFFVSLDMQSVLVGALLVYHWVEGMHNPAADPVEWLSDSCKMGKASKRQKALSLKKSRR